MRLSRSLLAVNCARLNDLPLLEAVRQPVAVNADERLSALAQAHGPL